MHIALSSTNGSEYVIKMSRPELLAPPEVFYGEEESQKYSHNTRMIEIQARMAERAIELLNLSEPGLILDLGCGSGLSGESISENGHAWIGIDVSSSMLSVASSRSLSGDLVLGDIGQGFGFVPGSFDGCISISVLQWLCNSYKSSENPYKRLSALFESLYAALARGRRAVFQFYPENPQQIELVTHTAVKSGFMADLIIDFPDSTKAKKFYLVLFTGSSLNYVKMAAQEGEEEERVKNTKKERKHCKAKKDKKKTRAWIKKKKESQRKSGKEVKHDSKYSGRRRKGAF